LGGAQAIAWVLFLHDEAGAVVFGRSGLRHYLSSFVRPLLSATQKEISVSLNNQKVRFK
jgi:hypothetical protein